MDTTTKTNYKGRKWTCDEHNTQIEGFLLQDMPKTAQEILRSVHPKKGNTCRECARLWDETPPSSRQAETPFGASYRDSVPDDGHQKRQQKGKK